MEPATSITCEMCGKTITSEGLPEIKEDMGLVAVDHGDHIVVVKYDDNGIIRDYSIYPVGADNVGKTSVKCPVCEREVIVPLVKEFPSEFLYNHGDHVVVLYMFDTDLYTLDSLPLIKAETISPRNYIGEIIKTLGVEGLSSLIAYIVIGSVDKIEVPEDSYTHVMDLLRELGVSSIKVEIGNFNTLPDDYLAFFNRVIKNNMANPSVLIDKFKYSLRLINEITNLVMKLAKDASGNRSLKDLMRVLKRRGLLLVVLERVKNLDEAIYRILINY